MPRVYDKEGRKLTVGDRVQRCFGERGRGLEGRYVGLSGDHRDVCVEWEHPVQGRLVGFLVTTRRWPFIRAYTAPNLLLIDSPTEAISHTNERKPQ